MHVCSRDPHAMNIELEFLGHYKGPPIEFGKIWQQQFEIKMKILWFAKNL